MFFRKEIPLPGSAEGITLSGVHQNRTENGGDSGESRTTGAEGARLWPNLSGKRTEYQQIT